MTKPKQTDVIDAGDLRKYRTEIPNSIDDMGLSVYAFRLYAHLKRVAGDSGQCYQGKRKMAEVCAMSPAMIPNAKRELIDRGLIRVTPGDAKTQTADLIVIVDIWRENFAAFAKSDPGHTVTTPGQDMTTPGHTVDGAGHTVDGAGHTVDPKKEPIKKEPNEEGGESARQDEAPPQYKTPPPLPQNYARALQQANGHDTHYRPAVQVLADAYTEQARKLGIDPPAFTARINALAACLGKRSYIDAAEDDAGTLNALKGGVLTLAKLGYHTEADYRQLCESFATVNDWMKTPVPSLEQLTDHAGKVKDGVIGKDAKPRTRLPKPGPGGYYDFPTMAAMKDAVGQNPDLRSRVTVKGTKV